MHVNNNSSSTFFINMKNIFRQSCQARGTRVLQPRVSNYIIIRSPLLRNQIRFIPVLLKPLLAFLLPSQRFQNAPLQKLNTIARSSLLCVENNTHIFQYILISDQKFIVQPTGRPQIVVPLAWQKIEVLKERTLSKLYI